MGQTPDAIENLDLRPSDDDDFRPIETEDVTVTSGTTWTGPDIGPGTDTGSYGYGESGTMDTAYTGGSGYTADTDYAASTTSSTDAGGDDIEATRAQIEETRAEMSGTIDAIQEKLSPSNMAQQAKDTVVDSTVGKVQDTVGSVTDTAQDVVGSVTGAAQNAMSSVADTAQYAFNNPGDVASSAGSNIVELIKENPIPAALIGAGIGWLIMKARQSGSSSQTYRTRQYTGYPSGYTPAPGYGAPSQYGTGYGTGARYGAYTSGQGYTSPQYQQGGYTGGQYQQGGYTGGQYQQPTGSGQGSQGTAQQATNAVQNAAGNAVDQMQQTAGQVQDTASQLASQAQQQVSQVGSQIQGQAQQTVYGAQRMHRENPLATGAIALAVGAAIGLAIPETPKENELLGQTRDNLIDQAQQTVQTTVQQAQEAAQDALGSVGQQVVSAAMDAVSKK